MTGGAATRNHPGLWRAQLPQLTAETHKYTRGACLVWSGPALHTGASRLAARAALRIGAGIVRLAGPREALLIHAAHLDSILLDAVEGLDDLKSLLADPRLGATVIGPAAGVGPRTCTLVETILAAGKSVVLDADALTSFAGKSDQLFAAIAAQHADVVLTPHQGEFARLFGDAIGHAVPSIERAQQAARLSGAVVVLKGALSVIAAPDGRTVINDNAPPWLATAGSGDVLAGMIGGLLAQGMDGFSAAAAGVFMHGMAGEIAGRGMTSDDLEPALRLVQQRLAEGEV